MLHGIRGLEDVHRLGYTKHTRVIDTDKLSILPPRQQVYGEGISTPPAQSLGTQRERQGYMKETEPTARTNPDHTRNASFLFLFFPWPAFTPTIQRSPI